MPINAKKIKNILKELNTNLYEREEVIALSLLGALSKQNVFMLGLPGVGKSLVARRIAQVFKGNYFEYLMNKFSAPEDLFGPVSIEALKKDTFSRKTEGFLPEADFAFLDEIWKSSPAILNALLTISNERIYKNGSEICKVPLTYIISASNEIPPPNQGLEALYDRFPIRLYVDPISNAEAKASYLKNTQKMDFQPKETIELNELHKFGEKVANITIEDKALEAFIECIENCHQLENPLYISDRRQKQVLNILRYAALYSDKKSVEAQDMILLKHFLWDKEEDREIIEEILKKVIAKYLIPEEMNLESYKDSLYTATKEAEKQVLVQENTNIIGYKEFLKAKEVNLMHGRSSIRNCALFDKFYLDVDTLEYFEAYPPDYYGLKKGDASIDETRLLLNLDNGQSFPLNHEYEEAGALKKNVRKTKLLEAQEKIREYQKNAEEFYNKYLDFERKTIENKGNFIVGNSYNFLEEILEQNKIELHALKFDIAKITQNITAAKA